MRRIRGASALLKVQPRVIKKPSDALSPDGLRYINLRWI
jgi:hypothetical protein